MNSILSHVILLQVRVELEIKKLELKVSSRKYRLYSLSPYSEIRTSPLNAR